VRIRAEIPADGPAIRAIHLLAFPTPQEADLVENLRYNGAATLSLVAEYQGAIVGHVLFSPVQLGEGDAAAEGLGLAPVGVLPHRQTQGIGSKLIASALQKLQADQCPFVVVLGDPAFYMRFGFRPAREFDVHCKWDALADAFMLLPFDRSRVVPGLVRYRKEFDALD
jgi:putative acetyltransferase